MLFQQTVDKLRHLRLHIMAKSAEEQRTNPAFQGMGFEDRLGSMVDAEYQERENRRLSRLLRAAKLKVQAAPEDIDYKANRGLDQGLVAELLTCSWILKFQNLIVIGLTGVGKTWLACALGQQACRKGMTVMYRRLSNVLEDIEIARGDGTLPKLRAQLAKAQLLILDDFGLKPLKGNGRDDLLELIDDRSGTGSLLLTSQMPLENWHDYLGKGAAADAIMDRLVHGAWNIELHGDSQRKLRAKR